MYESFYGFTAKPFQLSPDPDFFFGSRGHRRAMAYLEYGLHQGEGFIVVTGEVGAGKTTLVQQLLRRLPANDVVPVQIVTTQLEAEDLLRVVAAAFGLPINSGDKSTLLVSLEQHLRALQAEGKRALLVVDEAQNLGARAIEELRMLSNFQVGTRAILQSFLLGQPELRDLMQRPEMRQLKQRIIAAYHLGPLDCAETRQYIEHRLTHVGWNNDPAFDDDTFDRIFAVTHGIPRRINTLADRLLLTGFLAERHRLGQQDVIVVADELRLELGPRQGYLRAGGVDAPPGTGESGGGLGDAGVDPTAASSDPVGARATSGTPIGLPRGAGSTAAQHSASVSQGRLAALEERVDMLESTTSMVFNALKKLLRLMRVRASDRTADDRDAA